MTEVNEDSPIALTPLLPGQESQKPTEEEAEKGDGSIIFEFEDEDGNIFNFNNNGASPESEEQDGNTTTEEPVGLSPACLASLCG